MKTMDEKTTELKSFELSENVNNYLTVLSQALVRMDRQPILSLIEELIRVWRISAQVFLFGNGGSAALASHMACDLNKTAAVQGKRRLRCISLVSSVPEITAWANDDDYSKIFSEPLSNLCRPGDLVIAISCSGNSRNVIEGLVMAKSRGARTVGITGLKGGELAHMVDLCITVPVERLFMQEDAHSIVNHVVTATIREYIANTEE